MKTPPATIEKLSLPWATETFDRLWPRCGIINSFSEIKCESLPPSYSIENDNLTSMQHNFLCRRYISALLSVKINFSWTEIVETFKKSQPKLSHCWFLANFHDIVIVLNQKFWVNCFLPVSYDLIETTQLLVNGVSK